MTSVATGSREELRAVYRQLAGEHGHILEMLSGLRSGPAPGELQDLLESLHAALMAHFAHETYPDGFYQRMGACGPEHADELRVLVDEHFRMLASLWSIKERVRLGQTDVDADIDDFARLLERHERKEHELVERLMAG